MGNRKRSLLGAAPLMCVLFACANFYGPGTGSDTPNSLSGSLVNPNGSAGSNAIVRLIPSTYDAVKDSSLPLSRTVTTNTRGEYRFDDVQTGTYSVQSVHKSERTRALVLGIRVASVDPVTVPHDTLKNPGTIKVMLPETFDAANGYVYVPGTTITAVLAADNNFATLDSVPSGIIPIIYYAARNNPDAPRTIGDSILLAPDSVMTIAYFDWKFSRKIGLNTTASGAGVSENVYNFPVLIRLTAANFNFADAASDGRDIRFTKSNGAVLPYEIERWDSANAQAEIWVKADTILGNNSTQTVLMYYGNPGAANRSAGIAVFDTSNGFQGVWHLTEKGNAAALDATVNHFDGSKSGFDAASTVAGPAGPAQRFNGSTSYISIPSSESGKLDYQQQGVYTLSAWIYADSLYPEVILEKGDSIPSDYCLRIGTNQKFEFYEQNDALHAWDRRLAPATIKVWKYVTGVRNGAKAYLYIDDTCIDSIGVIEANSFSRTPTGGIGIGRNFVWNANYFKGFMDEVRIENKTRSADWVRLSYMNQKENGALVEFP
jgi:hypothetical protein